jgi:hypothetical protein
VRHRDTEEELAYFRRIRSRPASWTGVRGASDDDEPGEDAELGDAMAEDPVLQQVLNESFAEHQQGGAASASASASSASASASSASASAEPPRRRLPWFIPDVNRSPPQPPQLSYRPGIVSDTEYATRLERAEAEENKVANASEQQQCSICLNSLLNPAFEKRVSLKCGHLFHFECVNKNNRERHPNSDRFTCPECRGVYCAADIRTIYLKC